MSTPNTHFGARKIEEMLRDCKSVYFIGAGGINMSSLALISKRRGYAVGGSDRTRTELTERLENAGITVNYSHEAQNVKGYDAVIYTVAISEDNPEYAAAKQSGKPLISRADYLGYLMMNYPRRVGISGMHGKSSCTSMCAQVFIEAGADPTVMSGAQMTLMRGAYRIGEGEDFIFEACEYMDSFLDFNPNIAVILNVELDHVDYFRDLEQVISSYSKFADIAGKDGCAVFNADDENVISSLENFDGTRISFSIKDRSATFFADNISFDRARPHFDIMKNGQRFCSVKLAVCGEHNVYNALACAAAADACGISAENIAKGLSHFCGAQRRLEYKGSFMGADVFDDYAHHPSEVKATLDCVADMGYDRVVCVFQSHTYSRTAALLDEFSTSFGSADIVMVADIYSARETDTLGMSAEALAQAIGENAVAVGSFEKIANELKHTLRNGDLLVVMGAGDIYKVFDYLEI